MAKPITIRFASDTSGAPLAMDPETQKRWNLWVDARISNQMVEAAHALDPDSRQRAPVFIRKDHEHGGRSLHPGRMARAAIRGQNPKAND